MTEQQRVDLSLASHPWHAAYWAILAPTLYALIIVRISVSMMPVVGEVLAGERPGTENLQWLIYTLISFLVLIRMTQWADRIGAGPFAGTMRARQDWLALSALLGPVVLMGGYAVAGALFGGGDPDWAFREERDLDLLGPAGFGLMMIANVVILSPIVEEVAFRGILLGCLLGRGAPPGVAAVGSSAAFAGMHFQYTLIGLVPIFATGMFFAWLRIRTGGMAAPIVAHMAANAAPVFLLGLQAGATG